MTLPILIVGVLGIIGVIMVKRNKLKTGFMINMVSGVCGFVYLMVFFGPIGIISMPFGICYWGALLIIIGGIIGYGDTRPTPLKKEEKIISKKEHKIGNIINLTGMLTSMVGGIFALIYGLGNLITADYWEESYFIVVIIFSGVTIAGDVIGIFVKRVGYIVSILIGFIGVLLVVVLGYGGWDLTLVIPVILILIGGIITYIGWCKQT
jgi:hypothetical protein